jgi:serine/threonine-protein kinase
MQVRCPHCKNSVEVVEESSLENLSCSSCGSNFRLVGDRASTFERPVVGKTAAHFQLIGKLGAGAFGEVWRAKDTKLDRIVAVKIPPPHVSFGHSSD